MNSIRIGTRGSTLALAQTAWVKEKLEEKYPAPESKRFSSRRAGIGFSKRVFKR